MKALKIDCRNVEGDYVIFECEEGDDHIDLTAHEERYGTGNILLNLKDANKLARWLLDCVDEHKEKNDVDA